MPHGVAGLQRRDLLGSRGGGGRGAQLALRAVARPRGRPQPFALDRVRKLVEEAGRRGCTRAGRRATRAIACVSVSFSIARVMPTYASRRSSSISLSSIERECGKIPSSIPIRNTARNSSPFALWIVISVTSDSLVGERVLVGDERDLLQERRQRRLLPLGAELARDADELLEVLDPAARLDRALGLERLERAAACEHRLDQLVELELLRRRLEREHQSCGSRAQP